MKAETGSDRSAAELTVELNEVVEAWKNVTYPTAWKYLCGCADMVYDPGYVTNPWGRRRRFYNISRSDRRHDLERQAQNFPIQSTVADTMGLALKRTSDYRDEHELTFTIPNQIHDALMLYVRRREIEVCDAMLRLTMGGIPIPVGGVVGTLMLGVDVEVHPERWGEKQKE